MAAELITFNDVPAPAAAATSRRRFLGAGDIAMVVAALVLGILLLAAILAPVLPIPAPNATDVGARFASVGSDGHLLGADALGRDLLSRALHGARISFLVAIVSTALGFVAGGALGLLAGYRGGPVDTFVMRTMDVILAFPALVLVIAISAFLGPSLHNVIVGIGFFAIPAYARLSRASALQLSSQDFVLAARLVGRRGGAVLWKHYVPNVLPALMAFALINIALAILVESSLSFLGLGLRPPTPSWGVMIAEGRASMLLAPHLVLVPGAFLFVTLVALNTVADGLRARRERGRR
ncbi:MAG: ABC transporter permease [Ilumatobacteraceae bacterium]